MNKRVVLIICDSLGIGNAPDAQAFSDRGSNTWGNIYKWTKNNNFNFPLPLLESWGLSTLVEEAPTQKEQHAYTAKLSELSAGKDTTTGHWEIAGTPVTQAFQTFPKGFPESDLQQWVDENALTGYLGNKSASGTEIIEELGAEHIRSQKPIVYTSIDSVLQIAADEESFGLNNLYKVCESARLFCDKLNVGRVIARPFLFHNDKYKRTKNRKDFSLAPPKPNLLDLVHKQSSYFVASVGKIDDIFNHRSITYKNHSHDNLESQKALIDFTQKLTGSGFIFANFIDFDQLYGHRRDPKGYAECIIQFDSFLKKYIPLLGPEDLLIISADHGNDPTFKGNNHTREQVPLFLYSKSFKSEKKFLGSFSGFNHIAKLVLEYLAMDPSSLEQNQKLHSIYEEIIK